MGTHAWENAAPAPVRLSAPVRTQVPWIVAGLALGFLVPFVFADRLGLGRDLYYLVYGIAVLCFLGAWAWATEQPLREQVARRWRLTIGLAALAAAVLVAIVLARDPTARPAGLTLAGGLVWRGLAYGAIDGLLLSSFPILAVFAAFKGTRLREHRRGKLAIGAIALATSLLMTGVYHVGYSDFRSAKVRNPLAGDVVWSLPTLLTLNPIGAPISHAALHVAAVLHTYKTDLFLPPHR
jgi:hypothetical protein